MRREVLLPTSPDRVWTALTREMSGWFGAEVEVDLRRGLASFRWPDGWERGAVLEEVEAPQRLTFRWLPFERNAAGGTRPAGTGRVEFRLEVVEGGTRLSVTEFGRGMAMLARMAS